MLVAALSAGFALAGTAPAETPDWTVLQAEQVHVACAPEAGRRWCMASAVLQAKPEAITRIIDDVEGYATLFPSVQGLERFEDTIQVKLAVPGLLPELAVAGTFTRAVDGKAIEYTFAPLAAGDGPAVEGCLRVSKAQGGTRIDYSWRMPDGMLPDWLLDPIAKQHGHNLLWGLALGADTEPTVPS